MQVTTSYPWVEKILADDKSVIADDFDGYRNHVTRMLNFCHFLAADISDEDSKKLQIAAAFHDIALWTHDRVDYLVPSYQECTSYLEKHGLNDWISAMQIIIDMHHLLTEYQGPHQRLAELFRKADLVDFSLGVIKNGVDASFVTQVKQTIPNAGFHKTLLRFSLKQLTRNPLNPLPMLRIKNIYK
ncbi:HD domain-containing protein [Thalassotalea maritima]|uniref:HD domain-containing protein n=1 Tax=Thalassotalea maritima TaxID=3242416 RepID=UPI003526FF49